MNRTIKFLLGVIAASLLMLNLQLAGVSLVKDAHAKDFTGDIYQIKRIVMEINERERTEAHTEDAVSTVQSLQWIQQIVAMCLDSPTCRQFNPNLDKKMLQRLLDNNPFYNIGSKTKR